MKHKTVIVWRYIYHQGSTEKWQSRRRSIVSETIFKKTQQFVSALRILFNVYFLEKFWKSADLKILLTNVFVLFFELLKTHWCVWINISIIDKLITINHSLQFWTYLYETKKNQCYWQMYPSLQILSARQFSEAIHR